MVAFFIFMTWLAMEVIDVYMPPGKHNIGTSESVTQKLSSAWPVYNLTESQFFVAYKMRALEPEYQGDEDRYFSGVWLQRKNGQPVGHKVAKKCQEIIDADQVSNMFW